MFDSIPSQLLVVGSTIMAIVMGSIVMVARMRSQKKPVNAKKILIPPIAMSSGALMFFFEDFRVSSLQILEAIGIGIIFSIVLIATSKFEIRENNIYLKRSKAFFIILAVLLLLRVLLKLFLAESFHIGELAGMFWILGFSMLWPWRLTMLAQYQKYKKQLLD
jgi:membrane protein CcdC involved in cytochrome C biogenesis